MTKPKAKPKKAQVRARNVNHPGYTHGVDAGKFAAYEKALLAALKGRKDGLTLDELARAMKPKVPKAMLPTSGDPSWWMMTVKLDLEARGRLVRVPGATPQRVVLQSSKSVR